MREKMRGRFARSIKTKEATISFAVSSVRATSLKRNARFNAGHYRVQYDRPRALISEDVAGYGALFVVRNLPEYFYRSPGRKEREAEERGREKERKADGGRPVR